MFCLANEPTFDPLITNWKQIIMNKERKMGIWMDHFNAYLLESINGEIIERIKIISILEGIIFVWK
jgi:hypothetical protein